ncbi:hypothetical protein GCM10010401_06950 [Rarobacter faecitabidus]|uniref:Uncharacterized protein n=1 Tax=Rarobacter faecitabidus TaxID=13243 RepID=A0A542ZTE2_RARFA|nr:hypothetical protein [Rarobacter faecitabidus]TQL63557.1 hypothetical protein FB461_0017 [Rarobacter faecitabidus]
MTTTRIYRAHLISYPAEACVLHPAERFPEWLHTVSAHWPDGEPVDESQTLATLWGDWKPKGWQPPKDRPDWTFWWPSTDRIYRSRSSAQARVDLLESFGAKAVLVESDLNWRTTKDANTERRNRRAADRIAKHEAAIANIKKEIAG